MPKLSPYRHAILIAVQDPAAAQADPRLAPAQKVGA
jgi:hypothetical protein